MIIVPTRVCNTDKCGYCWVLKKDFENKYFENLDINDFSKKLKILTEKSQDFDIRFFWWEPESSFFTNSDL